MGWFVTVCGSDELNVVVRQGVMYGHYFRSIMFCSPGSLLAIVIYLVGL